jgi:fimbrial chaperone protein
MNTLVRFSFRAAICGLLVTSLSATDLRIAPVTIDPLPGAQSGSLTLINEAKSPMDVQVRVFQWSQTNGQDTLTPTQAVVASPPMTTLAPGEQYLVRVVRANKAPVKKEESYRVVVDEIARPGYVQSGQVQLVLRQSIPVFFSSTPRLAWKIDWQLKRTATGYDLVARNQGTHRVRFSEVTLTDQNGKVLYAHPGLAGYVLADSEMRWAIGSPGPVSAGSAVKLTAQSDAGPVDVSITPSGV